MTTAFISTNDTNGFTFSSGTNVTVLPGVVVSIPNGAGLQATSSTYSFWTISVLGTVAARYGIDLRSFQSTGAVSETTVYVGSTGQIISDDVAIWMQTGATASPVINYGEIFGGLNAIILMNATSSDPHAFSFQNHGSMTSSSGTNETIRINSNNAGEILNTGTMTNSGGGVVVNTNSSVDVDMVNSGTIYTSGIYAIVVSGELNLTNTGEIFGGINAGSGTIDAITNSGLIDGILAFGSGNDTYTGLGNGVVTGGIYLGNDQDTAMLGDAGGSVFGGSGDDTITGGAGADVLNGDADNDSIRGRDGDDEIIGGFGNDTLRAGRGDGEVYGGTGDDVMRGGAGEDILVGAAGSDTMFGGSGADVFVFEASADSPDTAQRDVIQDFVVGEDLIDLSDLGPLDYVGAGGFSGTGAEITVSDPNAIGRVKILIDVDGDGTADMKIVLNNTTALSVDDFIL